MTSVRQHAGGGGWLVIVYRTETGAIPSLSISSQSKVVLGMDNRLCMSLCRAEASGKDMTIKEQNSSKCCYLIKQMTAHSLW
ncbi:hypothetical protein V6N13_149152 [Hibiscus sabdariffa]|uniref:Uncharacterized protein n=1 Tax=Hibiscus sabdariffa TaxID=183260 RepID=A0ABR2EI70_9ROSI